MNADDVVRELIGRGFLSTAFQPIYHLNTGKIVGYEALMRGPAETPLASPARIFGPQTPLSRQVIGELDAACVAAAFRSGRMLVPYGLLFVNVHISTLLRIRELADPFRKLLESSGVPPQAVVIEISERHSTRNPRALSRILRLLRRYGFRFALDDFGLAYSGLQHLYWFEPEYVKLDRGLILGIQRSARKQALVAGFSAMCRKLGGEVIAEGVESNEEVVTLMGMDIPMVQGFHFGCPQAPRFWLSEREVANVQHPFFQERELRRVEPKDGGAL